MRAVDIAVIGGGPAALGAAASLRGYRGPVLVVIGNRSPTHPVFLAERAVEELDSMGLGLPDGRDLGWSVVASSQTNGTIRFPTRSRVVAGTEWQRFLHWNIRSCVHPVVDGVARLLDPYEGLIEIDSTHHRETSRIRARRVVWAAGSRPDDVTAVGDARAATASVRLLRIPSSGPLDEIRFTLPANRAAGRLRKISSEWRVQLNPSIALVGVVLPSAGLEEDLAVPGHEIGRGTIAWHDSTRATVEGRVLLVGDAAGLGHRLTGEGISFALRSGQIGGASAQLRSDVAASHRAAHAAAFGEPAPPDHRETTRRLRLVIEAISSAVAARSPARDHVVGLLTDQTLSEDGENTPADGPELPWSPTRDAARGYIRSILVHEVRSLCRLPLPSLTRSPRVPDLRLSDLLIACSPEETVRSEPVLRSGAAIDLTVIAIGLLAASVSDIHESHTQRATRQQNWSEIAGIVGHDVAAASALHVAAQAGPCPFEAYLVWIEALAFLRRSFLDNNSTMTTLALFETAFEFPCRLAGVCSGAGRELDNALASIGRIVGRAYALGEEYLFLTGRKNRLHLTPAEAHSLGLRCRWDDLTGTRPPDAGKNESPELSIDAIVRAGAQLMKSLDQRLDGTAYFDASRELLRAQLRAHMGTDLAAWCLDATGRRRP